MLFLDSKKPLYTCNEKDCDLCEIRGRINCHFNIRQLIGFFCFAILPFLIGGIGIWYFNPVFLIPWVVMILSYFMFIEIRVMCSHCPHYAEPALKTLKCWVNYGAPKLWKYKPGPMSLSEKIIFLLGLILITFYPYIFFLLSHNFFILIIYSIITLIAFWMLHAFLCSRCMNFACPLNHVDKNTRKIFFEKNPVIKEAWNSKN